MNEIPALIIFSPLAAVIRAVFFDFDGTLADTMPDMGAALSEWLEVRGKPPVDLQKARYLCSGGTRALLAINGWDGEQYEDAAADYLDRYEKTGYRRTVLFPGVGDMLTGCVAASLKWGIVTNKPRRYFAPIEERLELDRWHPDVLICGDDYPRAKPHPTTLLAAADICSLPPEYCLYVGDDIRDAQAAAAAGMGFAIVAWGYWQGASWIGDGAPPVDCILSTPELMLITISYLNTNL